MGKVIYAQSDENGLFKGIVILDTSQVMEDEIETENHVKMVEFEEPKSKQPVKEIYYIEKVEIGICII